MNIFIALFVAFQVKHLLMDFFFQTEYEYTNKGNLLSGGGYEHAAKHAVATWFICAFIAFHPGIGLALALGEFVVHYLIDFSKVNISKLFKWSKPVPNGLMIFSNNYFHSIGVDQFLHQLTYAAIIAVLCL